MEINRVNEKYYSHAENAISLELQITKKRDDVIRQHPIGNYFADFYFPEFNLVLEIDGLEFHGTMEAEKHDLIRDSFMNKQGVTVVRASGKLALENPSGILNTLRLFPKGRTFFLKLDKDIAIAQQCALNSYTHLSI